MPDIWKFEPDKFKEKFSNVNVELAHIHFARKEDKWTKISHSHKTYEFCFVLKGKGTYHINGKKFNMKAGDIFIAKPNQKHYETYNPNDPYELIFITIKILKDNKEFRLDKIFPLPVYIHITPEKNICYIFQNMFDEVILRRPGYILKIKSHLTNLIVEMYRFLYLKDKSCSSVKILSKINKQSLIEKIYKYIQNNYNQDIGILEIADEFHLSPSYLASFFKNQTGYSPIEYLTKVKIDTAKNLLNNLKLKISAVASEVGYKSPYYFYRIFKKVSGTTPTQYREKFISILN